MSIVFFISVCIIVYSLNCLQILLFLEFQSYSLGDYQNWVLGIFFLIILGSKLNFNFRWSTTTVIQSFLDNVTLFSAFLLFLNHRELFLGRFRLDHALLIWCLDFILENQLFYRFYYWKFLYFISLGILLTICITFLFLLHFLIN